MNYQTTLRLTYATASILLLPLLAMQFTDEVVWDVADFAIAGVLLFGTAMAYELVAHQGGRTVYQAAGGVALATAPLLVWINLAVGLIGNEEDPANLLCAGVLAVGLIGTCLARLRPREMTRALLVTALAPTLIPVIALLIWRPAVSSDGA